MTKVISLSRPLEKARVNDASRHRLAGINANLKSVSKLVYAMIKVNKIPLLLNG